MTELHDDHDAQLELFRLLHIGQHVTTDEIKYAYEQQMAQATRSGDLDRAMKLLAAYERMAGARKHDVYGRVYDGRPTGGALPATSAPRSRAAERRRLDGRQCPTPRKSGMSNPVRVVVFGILAPIALLAAAVNATRLATELRASHRVGAATQEYVAAYPTTSTPPVPAPTNSTVTGLPPGWRGWRIPANAVADGQGFVRFICAEIGVQPLQPVTLPGIAWPGSVVDCPPGAQAVVIRDAPGPPRMLMTSTREP